MTPPFARRTYADLFREHAGCDMHDAAAVAKVAQQNHIPTAGRHPDVLKLREEMLSIRRQAFGADHHDRVQGMGTGAQVRTLGRD